MSNLRALSQNDTDKSTLVRVLNNAGFVDCLADMFQKLSAVESQRAWVTESGAHKVSDKIWAITLISSTGALKHFWSLTTCYISYDFIFSNLLISLIKLTF